jgi:hypothetical protein
MGDRTCRNNDVYRAVGEVSVRLKKVLPGWMFNCYRRLGTAVLTPLFFSYFSGHFKSSLKAKAVDRNGRPLPWYTYAAIHFLNGKDLSSRVVLEWGAGQSTLWWSRKAKHVIAFEDNPEWCADLGRRIPENVDLHLVPSTLDGVESLLPREPVDLIVIDGLDRLRCAQLSLGLCARCGAILVDNSEGFWGDDEERRHPILELFRQNGYQRVDFFGQAPGVIKPHCTSLFFKDKCFLLDGAEAPRRDVYGTYP